MKIWDYQSDPVKKNKKKPHEKPTKALTNEGKCIKSHLLRREDCSLNYSRRNTVLWTCLKWGKHLWAIQCFLCLQCNTFFWPQGMLFHDMWLHYNIYKNSQVFFFFFFNSAGATLWSQCWSKCPQGSIWFIVEWDKNFDLVAGIRWWFI